MTKSKSDWMSSSCAQSKKDSVSLKVPYYVSFIVHLSNTLEMCSDEIAQNKQKAAIHRI